MSIWNKINDTWREVWGAHVKIDETWRDANVLSNVNGVWREQYNHFILESDIIGFRMVYKMASSKKHPEFPNLTVNKNLPVEVHVTGESQLMDFTRKGIVFQYLLDDPDMEGILMYEGTLYAVLVNGSIINVSSSNGSKGGDDRNSNNIPGEESWITNRISNLSIYMNCQVLYESFGYYMNGWNSMFDNRSFIDPTNFPNKGPNKDVQILEPLIVFPVDTESKTFSSVASIGIARNMKTPTNNMIGSYGVLDHSISGIFVDGISKPFVVEIYG